MFVSVTSKLLFSHLSLEELSNNLLRNLEKFIQNKSNLFSWIVGQMAKF